MSEPLISEKNPLLKEIRKASRHGGLTSSGFALAEGPHLLEEAIRSNAGIHAVVVAESSRSPIPSTGSRILRVSDRAFSELSSTESPQGVLALVRPPAWTWQDLIGERPLLMVLDAIQDPGNAGAIVRAAEAFGASGAVFLKGTVSPYNPKCLRASAGSLFRLPVVAALDPDALLAACSLPLFAADPRAKTLLSEANLAGPCALIIGSEGRGIRAELSTRATGLRIPTAHVESLNAAVAAGILLYEARRQRGPERS